jgi:DNA polymerase-3 subunit gamma/tau
LTLYNKYRPTTFDEMVGNESAIVSLQKAITKKNHSHVYLLSGPKGSGKTTLARIMATTILGASDINIREINSGSNRGIDTAREIIQQIRYNDLIVFILDEAHGFSNDFARAILKPLEDTPEHVYFFLCTTDKEKVAKLEKGALISRCKEVNLKALKIDELSLVIKRVCKLENVKLSNEAIEIIAEKAEGSPRSALVILESVLAFDDEDEQLKYLETASVDQEDPEIIELARALLNDKLQWKDIAKILKKLKENNKLDEPETVRYIILGYMSAVLLNGSMNKRAILTMDAFKDNTFNTGKFGIVFDSASIFV